MRISYVTTYDARNIHSWSGLGYYIPRSLEQAGAQVTYIDNLLDKYKYFFQFKRRYYRILGKKYLQNRDPVLANTYARQVEKLIPATTEIVFSPNTSIIAQLNIKQPIAIWTDATFAGMENFYPSYCGLCKETSRDGNKMEREALTKCALIIFASDWAASTAIEYYDVDPRKVKVVPFGANIHDSITIEEIKNNAQKKQFDPLKLLFVGVDWQRKGGDKAVNVAGLLNERGIRTELHIAGCSPGKKVPDFVVQHGFISKQTEEGNKHLAQLFLDSDFLILPTIREAFGLVFAEASSFGLPSLTTNVGGIPTAIKNGKNGQTFSLSADDGEYCDYIQGLISSKQKYQDLALSSFNEYKNRLNWSVSGNIVKDLLHEYCM